MLSLLRRSSLICLTRLPTGSSAPGAKSAASSLGTATGSGFVFQRKLNSLSTGSFGSSASFTGAGCQRSQWVESERQSGVGQCKEIPLLPRSRTSIWRPENICWQSIQTRLSSSEYQRCCRSTFCKRARHSSRRRCVSTRTVEQSAPSQPMGSRSEHRLDKILITATAISASSQRRGARCILGLKWGAEAEVRPRRRSARRNAHHEEICGKQTYGNIPAPYPAGG